MTKSARTTTSRAWMIRLVAAPAIAAMAIGFSATAATAVTDDLTQKKPEISVEAERTPQGAKVSLRGKNWEPNTEVKITGTRAPGSNDPLDLGTAKVNEKGEFRMTKLTQCTTRQVDDTREGVTITVAAAEGDAKADRKIEGNAWWCM